MLWLKLNNVSKRGHKPQWANQMAYFNKLLQVVKNICKCFHWTSTQESRDIELQITDDHTWNDTAN